MRALQPAWLTARPIAHRGLHDALEGRVENTFSAAGAAIERYYSIECDIQLSADGEAMVFHDFTLDRLTRGSGRIDAWRAGDLAKLSFQQGGDGIPTLAEFLTFIAGRVALVCEIKSRFNGDTRLAQRAADVASAYAGPLAFKSFDPAIMAHLRARRAILGIDHVPLGVIGQLDCASPGEEWAHLSASDKRNLSQFLHWPRTQPDFLSWNVLDLPCAAPFLCRVALGLPVMAWTVRTQEQAAVSRQWADQMVFEGLSP